jgi:hypothetical protein
MLCDVDLIKVSRKPKVIILLFKMLLLRRFPVSEFSVEMDRFIMKQIIFPLNFILTAIQSKNEIRLKSDQKISQ